jgi:hypothetical protein
MLNLFVLSLIGVGLTVIPESVAFWSIGVMTESQSLLVLGAFLYFVAFVARREPAIFRARFTRIWSRPEQPQAPAPVSSGAVS